jgi:chromate transporter
MMHQEVVQRRKWLDEPEFLDLLGAVNLIPGPNSTELAIHIGYRRRGWAGLLTAGAAFILPAFLITFGFGWAYVRYGSLPAAGWLFYGIKPAVLAVVFQALWELAPGAAKNRTLGAIGLFAVIAAFAGIHEIAVIFLAGALAVLFRPRPPGALADQKAMSLCALLPAAGSAATSAVTLPSVFWIFLKTGSVLFGSGYVLLAFLRADLVERYGWLTEGQLLDAIAVGQLTPGPVFTTATFIGYLLAGPAGALVATAGIFLPAFVFVALSGPLIPRLRASARAGAFLDGVNVGSLALMGVVTLELGYSALTDAVTVAIAVLGAVLLLRFKLNAGFLLAGAAALGAIVQALSNSAAMP